MEAKILVVEDDHDALRKIAYRLQYAGYQVTQAADGETAIDLLEHETFAVVLTDIVMGKVDGIDVLHSARNMAYHPAVILLTGYGSLETCMEALRSGAYDYLLKPCSPERLLTCIAGAIERHQAEAQLHQVTNILTGQFTRGQSRTIPLTAPLSAPPMLRHSRQPLHIGALTVGQSRHDVWFEQQPVHVTPTEYTLLRYLAEHTGEFCACQDIVRYTHGLENADPVDAYSLVKAHIQNLRKKLATAYLVKGEDRSYMLLDPDAASGTE